MRGFRGPDVEAGHQQVKSSQKKLSDIHGLQETSEDLRSRLLPLIWHQTHLSNVQKQPNIDFYFWYLQAQLRKIRPLFEEIISFQNTSGAGSLDPFFEALIVLWHHAQEDHFSLETAGEKLRSSGIISTCDEESLQPNMERQLAFFGLGLLSMLYQPKGDLGWFEADVFRVENSDPGNGHLYSPFSTSNLRHEGTARPFCDFLLGFGQNFIPKVSRDHNTNPNNPANIPRLHAAEFNAYIFQSCEIKIAWVEIFNAHLDFDDQTSTLYMFKFPGFCMLNMPGNRKKSVGDVLSRCISSSSNAGLELARNDLVRHMEEIILSTHLIFGQTKQARTIFNPKDAFPNTPKAYHDPFLSTLCRQEWQSDSFFSVEPKGAYDLKKDFPILWVKLDYINKKMNESRPKGIQELWRDSRNSYQWYTLWAVLVIGGLGLLFAIVQTALSAAQLSLSMRQNN